MSPINVTDSTLKFDSLASFVWHVKYMSVHWTLEELHEFLAQYRADDKGVTSCES